MTLNTQKRFYVYHHKKPSSGEVFYVGKGTGKRAYNQSTRNQKWKRTVAKHGIQVSIFKQGLTESEAFDIEQSEISRLNSSCNFTDGGGGVSGYCHTQEARLKISEFHKGRKQDPKYVERRAEKLRGKKRNKEFCDLMGDIHRGMRHSEETKAKMSASKTGKKRSPEAVLKTAEWHRGKKRSQASREAMRQSQKKQRVLCKDVGIEFNSISDAAKWLRENGFPNATKTGVWACLSGRNKTSYGMKWERV